MNVIRTALALGFGNKNFIKCICVRLSFRSIIIFKIEKLSYHDKSGKRHRPGHAEDQLRLDLDRRGSSEEAPHIQYCEAFQGFP